jgi:hypothetical protein
MAQQFTGLPMSSLIGAPLKAAAEANYVMAGSQVKFLMATCFNASTDSSKGDTTYTPIMIKMEITRGVITPSSTTSKDGSPAKPDISSVTTTFNLPLLTILPLNSLAVTNATVNFEMDVNSSYSDETDVTAKDETKADVSFEAKLSVGPFSVSVKGNVSYDHQDSTTHDTHYQKSNTAKYTVSVTAGQLPLPKGVNTIIEAYTNAIQPVTLPVQASSSNTGGGGGGDS